MSLPKQLLTKLFLLFALSGFAFHPTLVSADDGVEKKAAETKADQDAEEEPDCD